MGREWYFNWGTKSSSKKRGATGGGSGGGDCHSNKEKERKTASSPRAATARVAAAAAGAGGCMNAVLHMFDFQHFQLCLQPHDNPAVVQPTTSASTNDPTSLKGVEAPRNSLESEDEMVTGPASLASITEDEQDLDASHIPMGIEVRKGTRRDTRLKLVQAPRAKMEDFSSDCSTCSPAGARTPNVVARLMGLDILPESTTTTPRTSTCHPPMRSPRVSSATPPSRSKKSRSRTRIGSYDNDVPGPRSLPETPRSSSSLTRRRSTDVVDHHRLSLQINKENSIVKEMESSRPSCSAISTKKREGRNYEEGSKSPGYYARQIMKQVKETVSRRSVGADITNTVGQRGDQRELRRDELLLNTVTKPKKASYKESSPGKKNLSHITHSNVYNSPSPRFKTSELSTKLSLISETAQPASEYTKSEPVEELLKMTANKLQPRPLENEGEKKCSDNNKFESNLKKFDTKSCPKKSPLKSLDSIRNKDEQFVRPSSTISKKCKKTPLSSDLLHGTVPSVLVPLKKDASSSPSTPTKLLDKQGTSSKAQPLKGSTSIISTSTNTNTATQLSRNPSQRYERLQVEAMHTSASQGQRRSKDASSVAEFQYISRILKCTGIDRDTPVSFTRWFSPSHPLDPSIFYNLETAHYLPTSDPYSSYHDQLGLKINRKLIFHLVDEILADMLKPYIRVKPWVLFGSPRQDNYYHHHQQQQQINGFQLVKTLCTRIRSFPSANCETLQDIDTLVEKDFPRFGAQSNLIAFEEEGETIVSEIERDIVDSLVQEMAVLCLGSRSSATQRYVASIRV